MVSDALSWHWAFILLAPPGIAAGIVAMFFKDPRTHKRVAADGDVANGATSGAGAEPPKRARWRIYIDLFRIPSYVYAVAGMTAMTFALGGIAYWMPRYIHGVRGVGTLGSVNLAFGAISAGCGLVATLVGGWLGDKLRARMPGSYCLCRGWGCCLGFRFFWACCICRFRMRGYRWGWRFFACS